MGPGGSRVGDSLSKGLLQARMWRVAGPTSADLALALCISGTGCRAPSAVIQRKTATQRTEMKQTAQNLPVELNTPLLVKYPILRFLHLDVSPFFQQKCYSFFPLLIQPSRTFSVTLQTLMVFLLYTVCCVQGHRTYCSFWKQLYSPNLSEDHWGFYMISTERLCLFLGTY